MQLVGGFLCSLALAHIHAFRNRKAEEVVGEQSSFLLKPLTPAALLPTMYEVVSEGGLTVGGRWKTLIHHATYKTTSLAYKWTVNSFASQASF